MSSSFPFSNFNEALGLFQEYHISDYIDVSHVKKFIINFISDTQNEIHFIFSHNGIDPATTLRYATNVNTWQNIVIDRIFPFLKVVVVNKAKDFINNKFILSSIAHFVHSPPPLKAEEPSKPLPRSPSVEEELVVKPDSRDSTPKKLRSFFNKKKESDESRIPEFLSDGCLFVGNRFGKITTLPKGQPNQILGITLDGNVAWLDISK